MTVPQKICRAVTVCSVERCVVDMRKSAPEISEKAGIRPGNIRQYRRDIGSNDPTNGLSRRPLPDVAIVGGGARPLRGFRE